MSRRQNGWQRCAGQVAVTAISLTMLAACSSSGSDGSASEPTLAACDGQDQVVCVIDIATVGSDVANNLERAAELNGESNVDLEAGTCGRGGNEANGIVWSLCLLTLDDGRQIVVGRAAEDGLTVRAGGSIEFPLSNRPGEATLLAAPVRTLSILAGDTAIGSVTGS